MYPVLTCSDERKKIVRVNGEALFFEHGDCGGVNERFGVGENAVHVKYDGANVTHADMVARMDSKG
jgi:hypothetical protein